MRWIDVLAIIALVTLVVILLVYGRRNTLPDQIKFIQGKPIELRATHTNLLGDTVYDASCSSCSDSKVKIIPLIPFQPFDIVEIPSFLSPSECDAFLSKWDEGELETTVFKRAGEWTGIPTSRFGSYQLLSPTDSETQYNSSIISIYIFLNDDYKGGQLDFPLLLKTVQPEKGKAVIWRNLDIDRQIMMDSAHREVLVLDGRKWICRLSLNETNSKEISVL